MNPLIIVLPLLSVIVLFALLSLASLIDPRDTALQAGHAAPARRPAPRRRPQVRLHRHPSARALAAAPGQAHPARPMPLIEERKLHMHTQTGIRWLSVFLLALTLGGALASSARLAWAADDAPTATVTAGRLNVRTGPGVTYTIVTRIDQGQTMSLLGRNAAATWVKIRLPSAIEGWVNASYIRASVAIATLLVTNAPTAPAAPAGTVAAAQLELRSGPSAQNAVLATLNRGHALTLLGRTADSAWVKVNAGSQGEGWVAAQVIVRLPGDENGTPAPTIQSSVALSSLPVVSTTPAAPAGPRVSLSSSSVRPASPVIITVQGFPANRDIAAVLTSRQVPIGFVIASGKTDAAGAAQLFFRMPDAWPSGAAITETGLSLAVGTTDSAVLIWNGLTYQP